MPEKLSRLPVLLVSHAATNLCLTVSARMIARHSYHALDLRFTGVEKCSMSARYI